MSSIVIDTNAFSRLMAGDRNVLMALGQSESVYMSVIVLGELLTGFKGGLKERDNRKILNEFLQKPTVRILSVTLDTAEFFSTIKNELRKKGTPLPINDIWIASHCMETGSTIVTYDAHFAHIPGLLRWEFETEAD